MSELQPPRRLLDDGDASDVMRAALRGARRDVPTTAQHAAIGSAIAKTIADLPAPGGGNSGTDGGGGSAGTTGAGTSAKALAIGGLATVAAIGAAVVAMRSSPTTAEAPPAPTMSAARAGSSTTSTVSPLPSEAVLDVNALPSARPTASPTPNRPAAAPSSAPESAPSEMTLLREAQDAIGSAPATTLARCEDHARAYPKGSFAQEREVLAIDALLRLGRRSEAEQRAARFEAAHPGSAYGRRIATLLGH